MTTRTSCYPMDDPEEFRKMLTTMGPDIVSQSFRQPILLLWMALPPAKRDIETLKANVREQYERVLSAFESDVELLDLCSPPPSEDGTGDLSQP